jgi:hypothetical protein
LKRIDFLFTLGRRPGGPGTDIPSFAERPARDLYRKPHIRSRAGTLPPVPVFR